MNINSSGSDLEVPVYYLHWSLIIFTEDNLCCDNKSNNTWNEFLFLFLNKLYFLIDIDKNLLYFDKLIYVKRVKEIQYIYYQIASCILVIFLNKTSFGFLSIKANISKLFVIKISSNSYLIFHNFTSRNDAKTIYNILYLRIVGFYIGITFFTLREK